MESSLLGKSWREGKRNNVEKGGEALPLGAGRWSERPATMRADDGSGEGQIESKEERGGRGEGRECDVEGGPFVFRPIVVPTPSQQQQQEEREAEGEDEEAFPPDMWQFLQEALLPQS